MGGVRRRQHPDDRPSTAVLRLRRGNRPAERGRHGPRGRAAGAAGSDAVRRGIDWLVARQRDDGTWDEPQYTGTGFPGDFYINYHLYRLVFPVMALGRCLEALR